MKNRKLLVSSMIMILTCCLLFAGSTFAWFSDSVSSNNNIIKAGNLDVELEYYSTEEGKWLTVGENTPVVNNEALWEPGHVETALLRVVNNGSLALKYSLSLEVVSETTSTSVLGNEIKLSDYLTVAAKASKTQLQPFATRAEALEFANENEIGFGKIKVNEGLIATGVDYVQLAIVMPTTVGNEANHAAGAVAPSITFGVNLLATQFNSEEDSFGSDYDEGASWLGEADTQWYTENPTATTYKINTPDQLAGLAALVNGTSVSKTRSAADTFAGKTIVLEGNIDLNGLNWEPIGNPMSDGYVGFEGTFDGNGYTISNLTIDNPTAWGQGLFGYLTSENVVVKNLTMDNVNINAADTSGAVAGYSWYGSYENINVTGDVKITGAEHMGGVVGNGYFANFRNCSVVANAGSYITCEAASFVGGIVGYHGMANLVIENCTVKNLELTAVGAVGAITGLVSTGNTITGCVVENVVLNKTKAVSNPSIALAAGCWDGNNFTITNNSFTNVTLNGTSKEYPIYSEVYGSNYAGSTTVPACTVENNTVNGVINNLVQLPFVADATELVDSLSNGKDVVLAGDLSFKAGTTNGYGVTGVTVTAGTFDGNGNELNIKGAYTTWDSAVYVSAGTIKNLTVSGAMRGIFMGGATGDVVIDNVVFKDVIYTFNSDAGSKDYAVTVKNSTLNGWTSFSNAHKYVSFENCYFGEGSGYAFCRPYNDCEFVNCVFEVGYEFDSTMGCQIVFENCYVGDTLITAENVSELLGYHPENIIFR